MHSRNPLPYLALGIGILALAMSAIFVRWAAAPGAVNGFYRMAMAALVMLPVLLLARSRRPKDLPWPGVWFAVLAGAGFALDLTLWNTAVNFTTAANAVLLANMAPLWVGLGALIFFKEHLQRGFWIGLLLALCGAFLIAGTDFLRHPRLGWGDALALGASVGYAGYYLATQSGRRWLDSLSFFWIYTACCAAILLVTSLALRQPLTGYSLATYGWFLALALVTQVGGYLALVYAIGHLSASVVSPTMLGQPLITAILAVPLLGEGLSWTHIVVGTVVIGGVWLVHRSHQHARAEVPRSILTADG